MKKHAGMRSLDIVVLLKMTVIKKPFYLKDIADSLYISRSEVTESVGRSVIAGLVTADKKSVLKRNLFEFLVHGIRYVFPQMPGAFVRGIPTAHSTYPLKEIIESKNVFVWPFFEGTVSGQSIQPLYPSVPDACLKDEKLYQLLALVDALRVGNAREKNIAKIELEKRLCRE